MNFKKSYLPTMPNDKFLTKLKACNKPSKPCQTATQNETIVLTDRESSKLNINNSEREKIYKVKLDGCFLPENTSPSRCDWVLYCEHHKKILFIELKTKNTNDCVEQFIKSVKLFGNDKTMSYCILVSKAKTITKTARQLKHQNLKFMLLQVQKQTKSYTIALTDLLKQLDEITAK